MKNIYRIKVGWDENKSLHTDARLIEERKFISTTSDVDMMKSLTINDIDSSVIQDKSFYRYPKLTLPRAKVDVLKEKFNISVTRAEDKADYKIISEKYINSLCDYSWNNVYKVSDVLDWVDEESNSFNLSASDGIKDILKDAHEDDLVEFQIGYYWATKTVRIQDNKDPLHSNYFYLKSQFENTYNDILSSNNLITDTALNDVIYEDLHILTREEYNNCRNMLKSGDLDNRALALEMLANCNLNKSFDYVSMLFYFYYDYMKDAKNWLPHFFARVGQFG